MPTLTVNEADVLAILRVLSRNGEPVPTYIVRNKAWDSRRVGYDAVHRALRQLVAKGLADKPRRGFYVSVEMSEER